MKALFHLPVRRRSGFRCACTRLKRIKWISLVLPKEINVKALWPGTLTFAGVRLAPSPHDLALLALAVLALALVGLVHAVGDEGSVHVGVALVPAEAWGGNENVTVFLLFSSI